MRNELGPFPLAVDLAYKFGTVYLKMYHLGYALAETHTSPQKFYQIYLC